MEPKVAEIVTFRLRAGATEAAFLASVPATDSYLRGCSGFLRRLLASDADGTWVDFVEWRDLASAKAASDGFMARTDVRPFCEMIDMSTALNRHLAIRSAAD
jgi:hypothetical protein